MRPSQRLARQLQRLWIKKLRRSWCGEGEGHVKKVCLDACIEAWDLQHKKNRLVGGFFDY